MVCAVVAIVFLQILCLRQFSQLRREAKTAEELAEDC